MPDVSGIINHWHLKTGPRTKTKSDHMAKRTEFETYQYPKLLIIGIQAPYHKSLDIDAYFEEFLNLVKANNLKYDAALFIKLREIDSSTFLTKGKLEEVIALCQEKAIDHVIVSEVLTSQQNRNLTDMLRAKVFDRTDLILDIFEHAAISAESKIQVSIAQLQHKKSRLAGKGIYLSQQAGHIGGRGIGETSKERETRHIERTILQLKRELAKLALARETQRKKRLASHIPHLCLIGYTNAGKSTILNALTKSTVYVEDKLFATLDTTTRELFIDGTKKGILSDTVGFVQQLPPQLIEAFKSTLSELQHADLLLNVIDASDRNWQVHVAVVQEILHDLGVDKQMLYVFNKIDKIDTVQELKQAAASHVPHVFISARTPEGLAPLIAFLHDWSPIRESEPEMPA